MKTKLKLQFNAKAEIKTQHESSFYSFIPLAEGTNLVFINIDCLQTC